jgi:hypothetical protein
MYLKYLKYPPVIAAIICSLAYISLMLINGIINQTIISNIGSSMTGFPILVLTPLIGFTKLRWWMSIFIQFGLFIILWEIVKTKNLFFKSLSILVWIAINIASFYVWMTLLT